MCRVLLFVTPSQITSSISSTNHVVYDALLLFNPFEGSVPFRIPMWGEGGWVLELTTADNAQQGIRITEEMDFDLAGRSIVLFRRP